MPTPTIDDMIYTLSALGLYYVSLHATTGKRIELCYSKNHPCTLDETAYVTKLLFATATNPTSSTHTKLTDLFHLVLCNCKNKIIARLHKLCNRLRDLAKQDDCSFATLNPRPRGTRNPVATVATQCDAKIRTLVGTERFPLGSSLADFLNSVHEPSGLEPPSSHQELPRDLSRRGIVATQPEISWRLVNNTILEEMEPQAVSTLDITLLHPIRKLGDYHAAISVLINEIAKLNSCHECGVSIKEIIPLPPDTQFSGDFLAILNECAQDIGTTEVTMGDLSKAYRRMGELPEAPVAAPVAGLTASIHCECPVALAFVKSRFHSPVPTILVIGISKFLCWLCREFLATLHHFYPHITIHVPPCSGKLRSRWTLPPGAPSEVVKAMRKRL
ncbi:hypothetical protein B9Z19DRAFT_1062397 [Tuber borchii]|uniref:Uncharacterized protein n=1 Tax=Tuber borchii TaxID=42251 RepID=A0A2T7A1Z9_TUBBO|nr:hypothetical protein B9Z19DRAFT_1062397 [Tuber borchii]